jgi:hypothetical protein
MKEWYKAEPTAGFFSLQVALLLIVVSILLASSITWQKHIRSFADHHAMTRQMLSEKARLRSVVSAIIRNNLARNEPDVLEGIEADKINPLLTADPRFPGRVPGESDTPGFRLAAISTQGSPEFFEMHPDFRTGTGVSPLDDLRQVMHGAAIPFTMTRRLTPVDDSALLDSFPDSLSIALREIPLTQFSLVAFEALDIGNEAGLRFHGPAVVMGKSLSSGPAAPSVFDIRITPQRISDDQMGLSERTWEYPGLAASLLIQPGSMLDIDSASTQQQDLARRGVPIYFDGHNLSSEASLPAGITVGLGVGQVNRVVVNLAQLPLTNTLIDSSVPDAVDNRISAYHILCTTPLARDRGVEVIGDATGTRICDVITTNGVLILEGQHTAGPLITGSSMGGVLFNNPDGDAVWDAYLVLPGPSPFVSGIGDDSAPGGPRTLRFPFDGGRVNLTAGEQAYDSVGISYDPLTSSLPFTVGFGCEVSPTTPELGVWLEGDALTLRFGARMADGSAAYSDTIPRISGKLAFSFSRSQNTARVVLSDGSVFSRALSEFVADRPRVETKEAIWTGVSSNLEILTNPAGTALGTLYPGRISLRGLCCMGTITRYGPGTFDFAPGAEPTIREAVIPRLIMAGR